MLLVSLQQRTIDEDSSPGPSTYSTASQLLTTPIKPTKFGFSSVDRFSTGLYKSLKSTTDVPGPRYRLPHVQAVDKLQNYSLHPTYPLTLPGMMFMNPVCSLLLQPQSAQLLDGSRRRWSQGQARSEESTSLTCGAWCECVYVCG